MGEVTHDAIGLTRTQRRRLERLADEVDRVTRADARFFERHADRQHRIRLLSRPEREQLAVMSGRTEPHTPPGQEWIAVVRQVRPGARVRRFATVVAGTDLDQTEATCRATYEFLTADSQQAREIEATLRGAS